MVCIALLISPKYLEIVSNAWSVYFCISLIFFFTYFAPFDAKTFWGITQKYMDYLWGS